MFGNSHFNRVRQMFANQFTNDAHGYTYTKSQKGAQFRVSEGERNDFVETFDRRMRYSIWLMIIPMMILIFLLVWLIPDSESSKFQLAMWIGLGAILLPYWIFFYWSWNAPARELQGRTPASRELTKSEARALTFSKITYSQLVVVALLGVGLVWDQSRETDVFHGVGVIWLSMGSGLVLLSIVQMLRKWRLRQQ